MWNATIGGEPEAMPEKATALGKFAAGMALEDSLVDHALLTNGKPHSMRPMCAPRKQVMWSAVTTSPCKGR